MLIHKEHIQSLNKEQSMTMEVATCVDANPDVHRLPVWHEHLQLK
jgi:hypothetical protein